jgi:ATP-dependent Clp protease ATP-binding subunit ClpA
MLAEKGYDKKMGARPLARKIDELIRVPLSKKILFERIKNSVINVHIGIDESVEFDVQRKLTAEVGEDGIIKISE